jgi:hypothetical protein
MIVDIGVPINRILWIPCFSSHGRVAVLGVGYVGRRSMHAQIAGTGGATLLKNSTE